MDGPAETTTQRRRFEAAEQLERSETALTIERTKLLGQLRDDYHDHKKNIDDAVLAFGRLSKALYEASGSLVVHPTNNGPKFETKIDASKSKGITNMQIFCFDMTLMELRAARGKGPGFLVHDSHLFDGVDERQVAKALEIGGEYAKRLGFQYIVTMNSDALPRTQFTPGFAVDEHVLNVRLTDSESGGLFGLRFG